MLISKIVLSKCVNKLFYIAYKICFIYLHVAHFCTASLRNSNKWFIQVLWLSSIHHIFVYLALVKLSGNHMVTYVNHLLFLFFYEKTLETIYCKFVWFDFKMFTCLVQTGKIHILSTTSFKFSAAHSYQNWMPPPNWIACLDTIDSAHTLTQVYHGRYFFLPVCIFICRYLTLQDCVVFYCEFISWQLTENQKQRRNLHNDTR